MCPVCSKLWDRQDHCDTCINSHKKFKLYYNDLKNACKNEYLHFLSATEEDLNLGIPLAILERDLDG